MTKDTSRVEAILKHVGETKALVLKEYNDGLAVEDVYKELGHVEERFNDRLRDLNEWNSRQPKPASVVVPQAAEKRRNRELVPA